MQQSAHHLAALARNTGLGVIAVGLVYGTYRYVVKFGHLNPFANLEHRSNTLGTNTAIRLSDVEMRQLHAGKLVTKAHVGQIDVSKDRTSFDLFGIKDGEYLGDKGKMLYAGAKGNWNTLTQKLNVSGGVRVQGKNFDIQANSALLDKRAESLFVPVPLGGTLYGGKVIASNFKLNSLTGYFGAKKIRWQGKVSSAQIDPTSPPQNRTWDLTGDWHEVGGKDYFSDATATDGEVLIIAPNIVRDIATDVLTATGKVTYFSGKADVVSDKVVVYRKEHRAVFTGNVLMLVKPKKDQDQKPKIEEIPAFKPNVDKAVANKDQSSKEDALTEEQKKKDEELRSGKTLRDYPMQIAADEITYWYQKGERHAKIVGHPKARQDFPDGRWRIGDTYSAQYDGEKDTMELDSQASQRDAHLKNSIGDVVYGNVLTFSTKEDQDETNSDVTGKNIRASFVARDNTEDPRGPKKDDKTKSIPPPPPGKTGGGG